MGRTLQWDSTQKGHLVFRPPPYSPAELSASQTTLLKKLKTQAPGTGGGQANKSGSGSRPGKQDGGDGRRGRGRHPGSQAFGDKVKHPPRDPRPEAREPEGPVRSHLPPRTHAAVPACGPRCPPCKHGWLGLGRLRTRATRWRVRGGRGAAEVVNLNAWAGGKCSASQRLRGAAPFLFLSSPFPPFPSSFQQLLPLLPSPASFRPPRPPPRSSPPPAVTSQPKDKPACAQLPASGLGHRLSPGTLGRRRLPHPGQSVRPVAAVLSRGPPGRGAARVSSRLAQAAGGISVCYSHSGTAARAPSACEASHCLHPQGLGGGGGINKAFRAPGDRGGHVVWPRVAMEMWAHHELLPPSKWMWRCGDVEMWITSIYLKIKQE